VNVPRTAIVAGCIAIGFVIAQDLLPGLDWYHSWQYAAVLVICAIVLVRAALQELRTGPRAGGKAFAVAFVGALVVTIAGVLSGLLGPDTITISGAPGTVTPVPDIGMAAFFAQADPESLARGDAQVTLRAKDGAELMVASGHNQYAGTSIAYLELQPAAYIVARDGHGNRLTVTQPSNTSFLSPVLLFPNKQEIRGASQPLDTFATPALHRIIHALYYSRTEAGNFTRDGVTGPAIVVSAADDAGKSLGIGLLRSGTPSVAGDVHLTATIGTYPRLLVASAPHPAALIIGLLMFLGGIGASFLRR
jgi:hypothetical protein